MNLLDGLRVRHNLTYLLVSHDLAVVAHMCDRIAVMKEGEIVETLEATTMRDFNPVDAYTNALLTASKGYTAGADQVLVR